MTGEQLRELREALVMTQREFAEMVGVSYSTISNIESGARTMSLLTRAKIVQKIQLDEGLFIFVEKSKKLNRLIHNLMVQH
ncbi:helix-turn-helix domain-containing protein [Lysinibacillus fusiformis]|uniref:helix-turn-helix domain-containing protein n=1 Tax=Lysinibacillus fusiformis TaxID=28031 RepID=UPI00263A5F3A|nr:helix-turn-helix transcriptional regulator [Lysinibacillus fusiformis]MDC6266650.1 helix-turn-helix transcriptional regulator [Lysinibacillus sphaericus]MDN4970525.1 helix-turn-helix transcriptional regulator [Lysinibacillus fusiformis]